MISANDHPKDWFDWAETSLAAWKDRDSTSGHQVLNLVLQAAVLLNHDAVGAEHLLAGVLKLDSGEGAAALRKAGLTLSALRQEIERTTGTREPNIIKRALPYTPRCKAIIERAQAKVRDQKGEPIEADDLLLELLAEKEGLPARIFRQRAIDVDAIRRIVLTKLPE